MYNDAILWWKYKDYFNDTIKSIKSLYNDK